MRDDLQNPRITLDELDVRLIRAGRQHPRAGMLELSRLIGVSRATVQARLERMETAGVITGYGPEVDLVAAGYPVLAFVTLEIAQGGLSGVATALAAVPQVLEAYGTTGIGDVHCRIAATSNQDLQHILIDINRIPEVVRSTSVIVLSEVVPMRTLPLLEAQERRRPSRVPALRDGGPEPERG
ncbi:Lrp/AsnC family transcriptional regulator [Embleya sp. NBC_00896]|uniref:Lrp/AsnC family transcriptional regulator n=1 Tax=Embleya sp. NBC_00896 TaxID=2975961 RepID=UPI00386E4789|nr:Lrp/AsnC family transcriptional regulator [Embleya sp. NBC_00896]